MDYSEFYGVCLAVIGGLAIWCESLAHENERLKSDISQLLVEFSIAENNHFKYRKHVDFIVSEIRKVITK